MKNLGNFSIEVYPILGFAPGAYMCNCVICTNEFSGDKRSNMCEECAIKELKEHNTRLYQENLKLKGIFKQLKNLPNILKEIEDLEF